LVWVFIGAWLAPVGLGFKVLGSGVSPASAAKGYPFAVLANRVAADNRMLRFGNKGGGGMTA